MPRSDSTGAKSCQLKTCRRDAPTRRQYQTTRSRRLNRCPPVQAIRWPNVGTVTSSGRGSALTTTVILRSPDLQWHRIVTTKRNLLYDLNPLYPEGARPRSASREVLSP